jgi:plastocyanin
MSLRLALISLVTAVVLAGCGSSGDNSTPSAQKTSTPAATSTPASPSAGSDAITIDNFKFAPATLNAKAGAKVTVTNSDSTTHTLTADGNAFDTGDLDPGASKTITLGKAGRYPYHCQIHSFMTGTIVVS